MKSDRDMFLNKSSLIGGLATAIPGEIYGFWEAHKLAGKLSWQDLFQPSINLCRNGFHIPLPLANALKKTEKHIRNDEILSEIFIDKISDKIKKLGDIVKMEKLANTLEVLSKTDFSTFYNGEMTKTIVEEINENGGQVSVQDFFNYKPVISEAIKIQIDDQYTLYTSGLPSSGVLAGFIIKIMNGYNLEPNLLNNTEKAALFYHRLTESFKHAFAKRALLGDEPDNEDIQKVSLKFILFLKIFFIKINKSFIFF